MPSRSAEVASQRPFYDRYAEAYDSLISDPAEPWAEAVDRRLRAAGLDAASILDAGCGTGRHARALIDRGHVVTLVDASQALLAIAAERCPGSPAVQADICAPDIADSFDAVTCRGVLNDLIEDGERLAALQSFVGLLSSQGLLVLDVRETHTSRQRADGRLRRSEATLAHGARLTFVSRSRWQANRIVVDERYEVIETDSPRSAVRDYTSR